MKENQELKEKMKKMEEGLIKQKTAIQLLKGKYEELKTKSTLGIKKLQAALKEKNVHYTKSVEIIKKLNTVILSNK